MFSIPRPNDGPDRTSDRGEIETTHGARETQLLVSGRYRVIPTEQDHKAGLSWALLDRPTDQVVEPTGQEKSGLGQTAAA